MPSTCVFNLNKEKPVFSCGDHVNGTVTLTTEKEKNILCLKIIFRGHGRVCWDNDQSSGAQSGGIEVLVGEENYVDIFLTKMGYGTLPAGVHTYDFDFVVPTTCATSCETKFGHVRYELSLEIERARKYKNVFKEPLTIIAPLDLNYSVSYKLPIKTEVFHKVCMLACKRDFLCTLFVPYGGYAPGQHIKYTLVLDSSPFFNVLSYFVDLVKRTTLTAKSLKRTIEDNIWCRSYADRNLFRSGGPIHGIIDIPSTPPTSKESDLIFIEYFIKVTVNLRCDTHLFLILPIVIGTVPVKESLTKTSIFEADAASLNRELMEEYDPSQMPMPTYRHTNAISMPFIDPGADTANYIPNYRPFYPMYLPPPQEDSTSV